jgi:integrase
MRVTGQHNRGNLPLNLPLQAPLLRALADAAKALLAAASACQGDAAATIDPSLSLTLTGLVEEFLEAKEFAQRSPNYLALLKKRFRPLTKCMGRTRLEAITARDLDKWVNSQGWAPKTRSGAIVDARSLFSFAVKRGYLAQNPALGVDKPTVIDQAPGIHTPDQVCLVLETARALDLDVMRCLAIRYFAGLRTSEAVALDEAEIGDRYITVTAAKAKTRRRRLVKIAPNLRAWLDLGGGLPLSQVNNRLCWVVKAVIAAGVPWPRNAPRHSFCSYHLAKCQSAGETALAAGHTEAMLFAHYRELVTPEQAKVYWGIKPSAPV